MHFFRMARVMFLAVPFYAATQSDYVSIKRKFELIEAERLKP